MTETPEPVESVAGLQETVTRALRTETDAGDPLTQIGHACAELLPVDGAAISAMSGTEHRETLYASDAVIGRVEAVQFSLGEGPCFEAFTTGRPVLIADLAKDSATAWPVYAAQLADEPVGAVFAFPLQYGAARIGALDLYREAPGTLGTAELSTALQIADLAATALLGPTGAHDEPLDEAWLTALPRHREQVHQATGMLIAEHGLGAEQALARLRGYAFAAGRLVDDVAADLVARRLHPADIIQ